MMAAIEIVLVLLQDVLQPLVVLLPPGRHRLCLNPVAELVFQLLGRESLFDGCSPRFELLSQQCVHLRVTPLLQSLIELVQLQRELGEARLILFASLPV